MDVSYATMEAMGMLVKRLGQDARRLENALAETMNASAEWKRIADKLIEERDAERKAHGEYKERQREIFNGNQRLTAELAVIKDERNALRAECDDLRRVFSLVHGSIGINQGEHIGNAIEALKKERDCANAERARHEAQSRSLVADVLRLTAEIERLKKPARQHPVKVGEWLKRTSFDHGPNTRIGAIAKVVGFDADGDYQVSINGTVVCWCPSNCTPCDPPEATHITPDGKATAQAAAEPKPGDVVRLVRVPTNDEYPHDSGRWEPNWGGIGDYMRVHYVGSNINGTRVVRAVFGLEWPLSCIEVVKGGEQ
jgi:hypothetical protein